MKAKKIIMLLLLLMIIPFLTGCEDKVCENGICIEYSKNVKKDDTTIARGTTAEYVIQINGAEERYYKWTTSAGGGSSGCVRMPTLYVENEEDGSLEDFSSIDATHSIITTDLKIGDVISAEVAVYSDAKCEKKVKSLKTNKLTISPKSNTGGPYTHGGTKSVCPASATCISELNKLAYKSQSTDTNCHATALGYINGIATATGADFSSSQYNKVTITNLTDILAKIKSEIDAGRPVLARVYRPTRQKSSTTHSVTVVAYNNDGTKMSDFIILDPWGDVRSGSLVSCTLEVGTYMDGHNYRFCSMQYEGQKSGCDDKYAIMIYNG